MSSSLWTVRPLADGSTSGSNLTSLKESGLSLSLASMYSDADLQKSNMVASERRAERTKSTVADHGALTLHSAESVALSLIKQFKEKQLPKASDLQWLVSEQDAPQAVSMQKIKQRQCNLSEDDNILKVSIE